MKRPKAHKPVAQGGGGPQAPVPLSPRKPPPRRPRRKPIARGPIPGGYQQVPAVLPPGGGGGPNQPPARKKAKKARRKLAAPGENCVLDACYALAGWRPDLDYSDGLFIPDALEALVCLGLIAGYAESQAIHTDPQSAVMARPALILGVDLPGPHAVLVVPGGWHSWGELYDPADFPDAVVEEAWEILWPPR